MKHRTLSIGGATYDLFVQLPHEAMAHCAKEEVFALPLGAKIRVKRLQEACGGGASNTAVGLARLGCSAYFEGVISADQWGETLIQNLIAEGVNTDCITTVEHEVSSYSIILSDEHGERVILYEPGTNKHLGDMNFDKDMLSHMDWVFLNHIQEDSCIIENDIVDMLTTDKGPRLTWNPGGCQIDAGIEGNNALLPYTELLIVNKEEALKFTKTSTIDDAIRAILDTGVQNVCITDGKNGVTASDGKNLYHCPVAEGVTVIDTTGAGDAFGTGVTWGLLEGMTLSDALKTGNINAASVVTAIGAQTALLRDTEIRKRLLEYPLLVSSHSL